MWFYKYVWEKVIENDVTRPFFYLFSNWDSLKNRKGAYPDSSKNYGASYSFTIAFKKKFVT